MFKIAVLVSGSGSNLQALIDSIDNGFLDCGIEAVISDREGSYAIERVKDRKIKKFVFNKSLYGDTLSDIILETLDDMVDLIVLAGFLSKLDGELLNRYKNRIINIHPSLIPSFSGEGMYGIKVHEKALEYGVKVSGCTVHFVEKDMDAGPVILQIPVKVLEDDTPESLQKRIIEKEHEAIVRAVELIQKGRIAIEGRKVRILENSEMEYQVC